MIYVYDSSFVAAIIIPDEKNPKVNIAYNELEESDIIYAPQLIWYEIANVFKNLIRRKRYTPDEVSHFFTLLSGINLSTDFESGANYAKRIWNLCSAYNLSAYDSAYLELAKRKKAVLCTLDENLINAANKYGVEVIL